MRTGSQLSQPSERHFDPFRAIHHGDRARQIHRNDQHRSRVNYVCGAEARNPAEYVSQRTIRCSYVDSVNRQIVVISDYFLIERRHQSKTSLRAGGFNAKSIWHKPVTIFQNTGKHFFNGAVTPGSSVSLGTSATSYWFPMNRPGPAAKQPSPVSGQMTIKMWRFPQPVTPTVYSARWIPFTQGPCRAGWTTSREMISPVAD